MAKPLGRRGRNLWAIGFGLRSGNGCDYCGLGFIYNRSVISGEAPPQLSFLLYQVDTFGALSSLLVWFYVCCLKSEAFFSALNHACASASSEGSSPAALREPAPARRRVFVVPFSQLFLKFGFLRSKSWFAMFLYLLALLLEGNFVVNREERERWMGVVGKRVIRCCRIFFFWHFRFWWDEVNNSLILLATVSWWGLYLRLSSVW